MEQKEIKAVIEKKFIVGIKDIDATRRVTNKALMRFMENLSCIPSDLVGYGINDIPRNNFAWILLDWKVKIFSRPQYGEELVARTWSRGVERLHALRDFEIVDKSGNQVAIATSKWVLINYEKHKIIKVPEEMESAYPKFEKEVFENYDFDKLKEPQNIDGKIKYKIRKADIDLNSHVNNISYLDIAFESLPFDEVKCYDFKNIRITYKHEIKPNKTVNVAYKKINEEKYAFVIKDENKEDIHSIIEVW